MSTRKVAPGNRNIVDSRVTEARSTGTPGIWHRVQGAVRNSERRCPLAARPDLKSPKRKIHIIAVNPLKLSAGPCFSQKVIWDEKCLCFEKIERQLPERVPYQLWYILNEYDCLGLVNLHRRLRRTHFACKSPCVIYSRYHWSSAWCDGYPSSLITAERLWSYFIYSFTALSRSS